MATISKISTFKAPNFFRFRAFFRSFYWVLPAAWPRAAAPEATHRCTSQRRTALIRSSCSGSSRPRRPWMRRTTRAVASDEDSGGNLLSQWDRCEEADAMLIVQDFLWIFVDSLWKVGQSICNNGVASMFSAPCVYRQGIFY